MKRQSKVDPEQMWKLITRDFRHTCKAWGYICVARLLHGVPYLFLIDKDADSAAEVFNTVKHQNYAKVCAKHCDYVIEGKLDSSNGVYFFDLVKYKYPWDAIQRAAEKMIYNPQEIEELIIHQILSK